MGFHGKRVSSRTGLTSVPRCFGESRLGTASQACRLLMGALIPPTVVSVGGSVTVRTLAGTDSNDNIAIVDREYVPANDDPNVTDENDDRTQTAVIHYEISGANIGIFTRREITLEIDDNTDPRDPPITAILLPNVVMLPGETEFLRTEWDGRFVVVSPTTPPNPPYGLFYAHIGLKINTDTDLDWEHYYASTNYREIMVYSYPVADAGADQTVILDSTTGLATVNFNGGGSDDPDGGDIQKYKWFFGDGTPSVTKIRNDNTRNPELVSHSYSKAGTYTVRLEVTDNEGHTSRLDRMTVTVSEIGVNILNADASSVIIDTEYDHNRDNDSDLTIPATVQYQITGGSAESITQLRFTLEIDDDQDAATNRITSVTKTVAVDTELARTGDIDWNGKNGNTPLYGSYYAQLKLEVNSDEDAEWEDEDRSDTIHRITVDAYPVPDAGDDETVDLNPTTNSAEVTFNGSGSYDPDGNEIQTYTWDFGDDSTPVTVATNPTSHAYGSAGSYTVELTVTDDERHTTPTETSGHRGGDGEPEY